MHRAELYRDTRSIRGKDALYLDDKLEIRDFFPRAIAREDFRFIKYLDTSNAS